VPDDGASGMRWQPRMIRQARPSALAALLAESDELGQATGLLVGQSLAMLQSPRKHAAV